MAKEGQLNSALNLIRRMPPANVENSLAGLLELVPQLTDDLLTHVDQPLKISQDKKTGKDYILCDYNRDGDSYRSPWSNTYFPAMGDGFLPSKRLRDIEVEANNLFDVYRKMYFEGGTSSVYIFETDEKDDEGFGACFLIHKDVDPTKQIYKGWWDSTHIFAVTRDKKGHYLYKLTTTVMVSMGLKNEGIGQADLSGHMTQQDNKVLPVDGGRPHLANLGKMLEDMELRIRNSIEGIYIQKTREVINGMRSSGGAREKEYAKIAASLQDRAANIGKSRA
jgi:capping protein beta